jgi:dihydrodipicolinate synthase/N-acetylneuraminate lyase
MCAPICTPFVQGGEAVDEGALRAHIDWLIENGIHIILSCGGDGGSLTCARRASSNYRGDRQARRGSCACLRADLGDQHSRAERKLVDAAALWERPSRLFFWTHDYNPSLKAACNLAGRKIGECPEPQQPLSKAALPELSKALEPLWMPVRQVA